MGGVEPGEGEAVRCNWQLERPSCRRRDPGYCHLVFSSPGHMDGMLGLLYIYPILYNTVVPEAHDPIQ